MANIKAATAKSVLANSRAKPPPEVSGRKATPPPVDEKKPAKLMTIRLPGTSKGTTVPTTVGLRRSRFDKPRKKAKPGWEKDSDEDTADEEDEGFSVINHDHADTKN
jgi:hypothetical protein